MSKTLREKQIDNLLSMLHVGEKSGLEEEPDSDDWKILVYDKLGRDVISPLLKIGDLKASSVTLHLLINSPRQPIPDVPAVYFVEPTDENVKRICQDLRNRMYETYYFNFLSPLPRAYLEEIAQVALETDTFSQVAKIYDQFQNFICLEPKLFTLNMPNVFFTINNPSVVDAEIEESIEKITDALFSVIVTSEEVPIIRCPKGEAAEMVAQKLDQRIKNQVFNQKNPLFNENLSLTRPVFIIVDRSIDLQTMLAHNWTYQAMVHDVFDMKLNKLSIQTPEGKKSFDLDVRDFFWAASTKLSFPQVADNIDIELNKFKEEYGSMTKQDELMKADLTATTETLKTMMSAIPGINERKRILDMHMSIATNLLNHIKERQLDYFYTTEENISKQTKNQILEVLRDPQKGLAEDKLRFFLMFYLSCDEISDADMQEYETALAEIKCPTHCIRYLKQVKGFGKLKQMTGQTLEYSNSTVFGNLGFMLGDGVVDNAVQMLKAGVKSFKSILPSEKALPLTKVVESIVEGKPHPEADQYLYLDPKSKRNDLRPPPKAKGIAHQNVFVFVIGGGNYKEYLNLQEYSERVNISLTYGSTDINRPSQFLGQLNDLGNPNPKSEIL